MQSKGSEQKQKIFTTPVGYSNLIFTHHHRLTNAMKHNNLNKSVPLNKQYNNLMERRKSMKSLTKNPSYYRYSQSVQFPHHQNSKLNVINLTSFTTKNRPRSRGNSQNRITMSNVQRYYQFCVNKVNDVLIHANNEQNKQQKIVPTKTDEKNTSNNQNSTSFQKYKQQKEFKLYEDRIKKSKSFQIQPKNKIVKIRPNWLQVCSQGFQRNSNTCYVFKRQIKTTPPKITMKPRISFTAMCKRQNIGQILSKSGHSPTMASKLNSTTIPNTVRKQFYVNRDKTSFVLDAWQSSQNFHEQAF